MEDTPKYNYTEKVLDKYYCSVCRDVLTDPILTDCCGQHFCKACLDQWFKLKGKKCCPHCKDEEFTHMIDKPTQRDINDLKVHCLYKQDGCVENITRGELDKHLAQCQYVTVECTNKCGDIMYKKYLEEHLKEHCEQRQVNCEHCSNTGVYTKITTTHLHTCTHLPVECPNKCQKEGILRKDLQGHLKDECVKRQTQCEHCKEKGIFEHITGGHLETCLDVPIPCPRGCPDDYITRRNLTQHEEECEMEPVKCPFLELGCTMKIIRRDLEHHTELNLQEHLMLTMLSGKMAYVQFRTDNVNLQEELDRLREEMAAMKLEHAELKQKHEELKVEHYKLKTEHQELQEKL